MIRTDSKPDRGTDNRSLGRRAVGALAALALLAGCAGGSGQDPLSPVPEVVEASDVFDVGFDRIADVYLETVDMGTLTVDGLSGLSTIDDQLSASRTDENVQVTLATAVIGIYDAPAPRDASAWADLTWTAVQEARFASPSLREATLEEIYEAVFDAIVTDLDDYSRYVNAEEAEAERAARDGYGGIGLMLNFNEETGRGFVQEVFPEAPAERAGIRVGDIFIAVDGDPTEGWELEDLARRLRGPVGTMVTVTLERAEGALATLSLRREQVIVDSVSTRIIDRIGVLRISRFNAGTVEQTREALDELLDTLGDDAAGLILDLRGNPGGLLGQSVSVADLFVGQGDIITTRGRHPDSVQRFDADRTAEAPGLPMVVLVDGRSASGAEVVAAALQDSGRAVVVGASSFGKGSVQTVTRLPNGGELFLTWSRIYGPAGITIHRQGIMPTICTSGELTDAGTILTSFRSGRLTPPSDLLELRLIAADNESALEQLRAACPWRVHDEELDVEVAIGLLNDRNLYARALGFADGHSVAQR